MKNLILVLGILFICTSALFADAFDTTTLAASSGYNYRNPKFEKKNSLYYFTMDYMTMAYEKWDSLNSNSNIVVRKVLFDQIENEVLITNNNFLNTGPAVSRSMVVWSSNINSNLDIFYSNYNGSIWTSPQALQQTPQYEFTPDLAEYKNSNPDPAYYITYQMGGDIYFKVMHQGNFLLDTNLTSGISEGCTNPKIRIFDNSIYLAYLKSVNTILRLVIVKANINTDYRLTGLSAQEVVQPKSVSEINFSNGFASFPSGGGFVDYNYDTLGSTHTAGINLGNYSDKNVFTGNYTGKNINGTGSLLNIITDNPLSTYYFTVFSWLRKSGDSTMIMANGHFNLMPAGTTKQFYLGDSTVNSSFDISNYFPRTSINTFRFRIVWERKLNSRISLVESRFDDFLSGINPEHSFVSDFKLEQNYPNPFNPKTVINYELPVTDFVVFKVYDVLGNEAATLVNEKQTAGSYSIEFDGSNLSSGVYFYKIESNGFVQTRRMILLK